MPRIAKVEETNNLVWVHHPESNCVFMEFENDVDYEYCTVVAPARSRTEVEIKNILIRKWKWPLKDVEATEIHTSSPEVRQWQGGQITKGVETFRTQSLVPNTSNTPKSDHTTPKFGFLHGGNVVAPDSCTRAKLYDAHDVPRAEACCCAFTCQNAECSSYQKLMDGRTDRIKTQRTGETGDD